VRPPAGRVASDTQDADLVASASPKDSASDRGGKPSELALRWLSAGLVLPPLLLTCYLGGYPFVALVSLASAVATSEFYGFVEAKGVRAHRKLGVLAAAGLPFLVFIGDASLAASLLTGLLLATSLLQLRTRRIEQSIASIATTFFGVYYVGWLLSHAVSLRHLTEDPRFAGALLPLDSGILYMVVAIAAALGSDVGAFFVGRRFGRRKLAPTVSPGKTVEGAIGGLLAGAALVLVVHALFAYVLPGDLARELPASVAVVMGVVIAAASIVGDLVESLLKRDADLKDAGKVLPGVGGVLDRIDSALFALPVMYYLLLAYYHLARGA